MTSLAQSRQLKRQFLERFTETGVITHATRALGIPRTTVYKWRDRDPSFADALAEAIIESTELLEAEAIRRAYVGSDALLMFILKARKPDVYRDRYDVRSDVNLTGSVQLVPWVRKEPEFLTDGSDNGDDERP